MLNFFYNNFLEFFLVQLPKQKKTKKQKKQKKKNKNVEEQGFDPCACRLRTDRSTEWATPPVLHKYMTQRNRTTITSTTIRGSIVVSIPACHAGNPGSIPGLGAFFFFFPVFFFPFKKNIYK